MKNGNLPEWGPNRVYYGDCSHSDRVAVEVYHLTAIYARDASRAGKPYRWLLTTARMAGREPILALEDLYKAAPDTVTHGVHLLVRITERRGVVTPEVTVCDMKYREDRTDAGPDRESAPDAGGLLAAVTAWAKAEHESEVHGYPDVVIPATGG